MRRNVTTRPCALKIVHNFVCESACQTAKSCQDVLVGHSWHTFTLQKTKHMRRKDNTTADIEKNKN